MSRVAAFVVAALALNPVSAIWPIPANFTTGESVVFIDRQTEVTYNGEALEGDPDFVPPTGANFSSKIIVQSGVSRAFRGLFNDNFVPWKFRPRNADFEPPVDGDKIMIESLNITQAGEDGEGVFKPHAGDVDESYSVDISEDGKANIRCQTSTGCLHGLESFVQLFYQHSDVSQSALSYTPYAPVSIQDAPKFPHRGLIMDLARSWYPVQDIHRTLDAMSWNKMNRLHLHMTDTQSWPIEIPKLPELAEKGAYRKGLSYSPEDISGIFEHAAYRGIVVIVEINMPNHAGIVDLAYPDITVAYNKQPWQWWCLEPPCGAFQMNNTKTFDFIDDLFSDLLPRVSQYSAYFHTGGDELFLNDSAIDPTVNSNDTTVIAPFLQNFVDHVHGKVQEFGLTPLVWEDIVHGDFNTTVGEDVVVQAWLTDDSVKELTSAGHKVIDSNHNFWYLDCGRGQFVNFDNGPIFEKYYPFADYCSPTKNWRLMYSHDPTAGLTEEEAKLVLGGEVAAWSEMTDGVNLDTNVWPRASAAAEVLWSGRTDASGQNRSQLDAAPRLAELRERMVARGVRALPVQMVYCSQSNKTDCAISQ